MHLVVSRHALKIERCFTSMTTSSKVNTIVQITDPNSRVGFEEAHDPYYADFHIRTDLGLVETIQSTLTEVAVESGLFD